MKTKIITAREYQYEIGNEPNPFDCIAMKDDYTLSCFGKVFKYDSQNVLWLDGCPKIVASNDPELKEVLPILPKYSEAEIKLFEDIRTMKFGKIFTAPKSEHISPEAAI